MKKDIYIFRHGQTDKNLAHIWQGSGTDDLLNENGVKQVKRLAYQISPLQLRSIYCSPLLRSVQTANIIAQHNKPYATITILQDLREAYFGAAEGLTDDQVRQNYPDLIDPICNPTFENWDLRFPNGESKHETFDRVYPWLWFIARSDFSDRIGIVCHAGVLSALRCGLELKGTSNMANCSILHLQFDTLDCLFKQIED